MGKLQVGVNDFATVHPEFLCEWDYDKNNKLDIYPDKVSYGSTKKVWWKCQICGYEWFQTLANHSYGFGCPACAQRNTGLKNSIPKEGETLKDKYPELLKEWDYDKNDKLGIFPDKISSHSNKKVYWICKTCGHQWQASVSNRTHKTNPRGCSVCSRKRGAMLRSLHKEGLSLEDKFPNLAKQWNYEKNDGVLPSQVKFASNKKFWWKCEKGHEWQASINKRVKGNKCPVCFNKSVEKPLMVHLIKHSIKINNSVKRLLNNHSIKDSVKKFSVRHSIFCNDLATVRPNLLKEWDYDKNNKLGVFPDKIPYNSTKKVWWTCEKCGNKWQTRITSRSHGSGCPACAGHRVVEGHNDLATKRPDLLKEWNYVKNGDLLPTQVACGSTKKVWWKCSTCGYEWETAISHRVKGTDCPACMGQKVFLSYNDLATKNPGLASEWNYDKNGNLKPTDVTSGSNKKVWWRCKHGHEWQAVISHRNSKKAGCPYCSNKKVLTGYNDLATLYPELAKEWNYEKNGNLLPTQVIGGSHLKVWWKCEHNHEWQACIQSRSGKQHSGCPYCSGKKVLFGFNDLATKYPEFLDEWNYDKNDLSPTEISCGTHLKAWWKCKHCGHEWQAKISNRTYLGEGYYYLKKYFGDEVKNRYTGLRDEKGSIETDVYLPSQKIAVEYDGLRWHKNKQESDLNKECRLKAMGIHLIRITEHNRNIVIGNCILYDFTKSFRNKQIENLNWAIKELFKILNLNNDMIDIKKDSGNIMALYHKDQEEKSLSNIAPDLAKEWNYEKNGNLLPTQITRGSDLKVWWKCKLGHEWQDTILHRLKRGNGCPYCSNHRALKGFNDLETFYPEIAKEWNYEKNGNLLPSQVTYGSGKKVWWKCSKCGHEWLAVVNNRRRFGQGCPECAKRIKVKKSLSKKVF